MDVNQLRSQVDEAMIHILNYCGIRRAQTALCTMWFIEQTLNRIDTQYY